MELGCFMAGVVLSSNGEHLVHKVYTLPYIPSYLLIIFARPSI